MCVYIYIYICVYIYIYIYIYIYSMPLRREVLKSNFFSWQYEHLELIITKKPTLNLSEMSRNIFCHE